MLSDKRLENLLRDAHAVDAFERGDATSTAHAPTLRLTGNETRGRGVRRTRWMAVAAAMVLLAAAPFVLPKIFSPRLPDNRLTGSTNPRPPVNPPVAQPKHPTSSLLMAVYQNDAGKLSCVNWSADALKGRTIASLSTEELTRLGLTLACDPGAARILVVGLEGPAASLPTSDARARAVAQCLSTSPPCASGMFNPQTCASAGCLDHEVTVRIESLALH